MFCKKEGRGRGYGSCENEDVRENCPKSSSVELDARCFTNDVHTMQGTICRLRS